MPSTIAAAELVELPRLYRERIAMPTVELIRLRWQ
jgi:hypothetical protein